MSLTVVIDSPFVTDAKFAEMTGQTVAAVKAQMSNNQLPIFTLPQSSRQKDPSSTRRRKFINLLEVYNQAQEVLSNGV
jgi:hypothetical protein